MKSVMEQIADAENEKSKREADLPRTRSVMEQIADAENERSKREADLPNNKSVMQQIADAENERSRKEAGLSGPWMKSVSGDVLLSLLSIPGTHQSYLRKGSISIGDMPPAVGREFAYCQHAEWDIPMQLREGVRFMDFRMKKDGSLWHGIAKTQGNFWSELQCIVDYLEENPSECVLVSLKWEGDSESGWGLEAISFMKQKHGANRFWFNNEMPKLKDVRGKIVFLNRLGEGDGIPYNTVSDNLGSGFRYRVQDDFDMTKHIDGDVPFEKFDQIAKPFLRKAQSSTANDPEVIHFNYLSAYADAAF